MSDEDCQCEECVPGLPAWMGTFADLMSLLMCFFVLLLSFSEMDVLKFKRLAGSMRNAFGVQNQIDVNSIPKGTSVIAQNFSPGKPEPTPLQTVMQHTSEPDKQSLELLCESAVETAIAKACEEETEATPADPIEVVNLSAAESELEKQAQAQAQEIAKQLQEEIDDQEIEIDVQGRKIIIRVQEKGSFGSGSAYLQDEFIPVVEKLIDVVNSVSGKVAVEGHSDDVPINTSQFPSNWSLSSARAIEVAHALFESREVDESRFSVAGYADTLPLVPNDSPANRAKNRRVEIVLQNKSDAQLRQEAIDARELAEGQTELDFAEQIEDDQLSVPQNGGGSFDLDPDEIF